MASEGSGENRPSEADYYPKEKLEEGQISLGNFLWDLRTNLSAAYKDASSEDMALTISKTLERLVGVFDLTDPKVEPLKPGIFPAEIDPAKVEAFLHDIHMTLQEGNVIGDSREVRFQAIEKAIGKLHDAVGEDGNPKPELFFK